MPIKRLIIKLLTAFSALRAGKVFAADNISVIASCQVMIDYYRELGHDFTESYGLARTDTDKYGRPLVSVCVCNSP